MGISVDINIDVDRYRYMAVSANWGFVKGSTFGSFTGFVVDMTF